MTLSSTYLLAQKNKKCNLSFVPVYNGTALSDTYYKLNVNDSIQIETLKFYISSIARNGSNFMHQCNIAG